MKCPNCGNSNAVGAKFCINCGTELNVCPKCGSSNIPSDSKFCPDCGYQIHEEPSKKMGNTLPPPPISPRTIEFECRLFVNTSDARFGILTVDPQKAYFKTKGFMSMLQGGGEMRFPIRSITGICLSKNYGLSFGSVMVLKIIDEYGNVFPLSGKGIYQQNSNVKTLTDIAYTLELYRRLYWIYDTIQHGYFNLEEYDDDTLNLNSLSIDQLVTRVINL